MRKLTLSVGLAVLLCVAGRAEALTDMTVVAVAPAATLLLPYFEIDPNGTPSSGTDTLIQLNNSSASAALAHVTVWTDLAVPVMSFQVYLTGFDVETIDMAEILAGRLPKTASAGQDPMDEISNKGSNSQDINFASCTGILPPPDALSPEFVAHVRASLTGQSSAVLGGCAGRNLGDGLMRGYVTIDTVNSCSLLLPGAVGYIESVLDYRNIFWGTYLTIDRGTKRTLNGSLVHVRASYNDPEVTVIGQYTFYGRLTQTKFSAADKRQPLGTTFGARFVNTTGAGFPTSTSLIVWRDPKVKQSAFACGTNPTWYPLGQESLAVFDEQEEVDVAEVDPVAPVTPGAVLTPFPAATQKVKVGGPDLPVAFQRGWIFMNLNTTVADVSMEPMEDPAAAQAWVEVISEDKDSGAYGVRARTSTVTPGMPFDTATDVFHTIIFP
jgi:hypothetical protein